jgi:hypothetical protein
VRECSVVPPGLVPLFLVYPALEALGYYQAALPGRFLIFRFIPLFAAIYARVLTRAKSRAFQIEFKVTPFKNDFGLSTYRLNW